MEEEKHIFIATPAFGGNVCSQYTESLIHTINLLKSFNIKVTVKFINNQITTRARNMLADIFMKNDTFTHMLFIDADVEWKPESVLSLIKNDQECVIGVYPNKGYTWVEDKLTVAPSSVFTKNAEPNWVNPNLVEIELAATGFMLLTKSALKRIEPDIQTFYLPGDNGVKCEVYNYFDCNVVGKSYLTEDYYFSFLFKKNGGKIYADNSIVLYHIGSHKYGDLILNK